MTAYVRKGGIWVQCRTASAPVTPGAGGSAPGSIASLTATAGDTYVTLTWSAAVDPDGDLSGYEVFVGGVSRGSVGNVLTATVLGLTANTSYTIGVRAFDAQGHNGPVVTATVTTQGAAGKPTALNTGPRISLTDVLGDWRYSTQGPPTGKNIKAGTLYLDVANPPPMADFAALSVNPNGAPGGNYYSPVRGGQKFSYATIGSIGGIGAVDIGLDRCHVGGITGTFWQANDYRQTPQGYYPCSNLSITNSLFDNLISYTGTNSPHYEGIHIMGCQTAVIRNNVFDFRTGDAKTRSAITAAVSFDFGLTSDVTPCRDIIFDGNWLYGGGVYQAYFTMRGNSVVTNNKFHRFPGCNPQAAPDPAKPGSAVFAHSGNTLADGDPSDPDTNVVSITLQTN